ncbi:MAG: Fic family protein [Chryseolinea sp.]
MNTTPAGSEWLKRRFNLLEFTLTHSSFIGSSNLVELTSRGNIEETFGAKYGVPNTPLDQLEFSLKYDDVSLDFFKAVFGHIPAQEVVEYIEASPAGRYRRAIGFLYELLTGTTLNLSRPVSGNYVDLLNPDRYVTGVIKKDTRWRINNNLLGTEAYCPIIRKTNALNELLAIDTRQRVRDLKKRYEPEIFQRVINYLYKKETRSSYEIEREKPSQDRMEKFITLLNRGGTEPNERMVSRERLITLQNAIVDPRFSADRYRDFQNYVGASLPNGMEQIDYICPPPSLVSELMPALSELAMKSASAPPEVRAAILSFGFVFIHPFEDGNGRIHRFLIHDVLAHDELVPQGMIIPVSAHMLNHMRDYDTTLEKYSKPLMQRARYQSAEDATITVTNLAQIEGYYRYPDLTEQCVYLLETIHATLAEDMPEELLFMQRYDEAKKELQNIVDMPDREINLMLTFLHQSNGVFPKRRRERFAKLTDGEIARMQSAYQLVFEMNGE